MYIEEYFAGQHREDQNYFIIYWNYLNDTQRIKICRCVVVRLGKSWRMRSLKANLETRRRMLHRNHHNTIEKYLFSCRILQGPAHTKLSHVHVSSLLSCENSHGYWVSTELGYKMVHALLSFLLSAGARPVVAGAEAWGAVVWVFEFISPIMARSSDIWKQIIELEDDHLSRTLGYEMIVSRGSSPWPAPISRSNSPLTPELQGHWYVRPYARFTFEKRLVYC